MNWFFRRLRCRECWEWTLERHRPAVLARGEMTVMHKRCARRRSARKLL